MNGERSRLFSEFEDENAALAFVVRPIFGRAPLPRRRVNVLRQLETRLLELVLTALFLFPSPDLVDDEGGQHAFLPCSAACYVPL